MFRRIAMGGVRVSRGACRCLSGHYGVERNLGRSGLLVQSQRLYREVTMCRSFSQEAATEDKRTAGGAGSSGFSGGGGGTVEVETEEEFQIKLKILGASLNHVNEKGWSMDALKAGANDLNLSESISTLCTPYDLVEYFQRYSNHQLEQYLMGLDKKDKSLYSSMEYRLKLVIPYIDRYHQAMGLSIDPSNVPRSLQVLRELSDIICIYGLGDTSTDLRWYAKRSGVISLYVATECCMVQDKSDGFQETWSFLDRRVKNYTSFETVGSTAIPVVESGITTILNILGMNRKR